MMRNTLSILIVLGLATFTCADPITPAAELPATTPWNLAALSVAPQYTWIDRDAPVRSLMYTSEPYKGKPTRVFAYVATPGSVTGDPTKDKQLPAVVLVHGGGGTAFRVWAEKWARRGYAAIAMDLAGHQPISDDGKQRERLPDGGPNQSDREKFNAIDEPVTEHWSYHAVANVIRAHSLIRSLPEIDKTRTALTGISWGGYLTSIVCGLDNRFSAAVPVYGCGFLHDNSVWLPQFAKMAPEQKSKWVTLYDPSQYLGACRTPVFAVNGTNDFAYPLDSHMKSFARPKGPKQFRITVNMPHGHPQGWNPVEIDRFIDHALGRGEALPTIISTADAWQVNHTGPLRARTLHYTEGAEAINKRTWKDQPLTPAESRPGMEALKAAIPETATAWFITVTDEHGAIVSSTVSFRP